MVARYQVPSTKYQVPSTKYQVPPRNETGAHPVARLSSPYPAFFTFVASTEALSASMRSTTPEGWGASGATIS